MLDHFLYAHPWLFVLLFVLVVCGAIYEYARKGE